MIQRDPGPLRHNSRPWVARSLALIGLLLLGGVASFTLMVRSDRDAERREHELTSQVAASVKATGEQLRTALAGSAGLVTEDGSVYSGSFNAFADAVLATHAITAVAYEPKVSADQRARYEALHGIAIIDRDASGATVAPRRDVYFPVQQVVPDTAATRELLGFDITGDAMRGPAAIQARDSGASVLTGTVLAQPDLAPAVFVIQPLYRPVDLTTLEQRRAAHVGFISTAFPGTSLLASTTTIVPDHTRIALRDGSQTLATINSAPTGDNAVTVDVAGRRWSLQLDDVRGASHATALAVALGTLALAAALALLLVQVTRLQRQTAAVARRAIDLAELGESLAAAAATDAVVDVVARDAPLSVAASWSNVWLAPAVGASAAHATGAGGLLDTGGPTADVVATKRPVFIGDLEECERRFPAMLAGLQQASLTSFAALPLITSDRRGLGVLSMGWSASEGFDESFKSTLMTIADLCEHAIERALITDRAKAAALSLSALASQLNAARTIDQMVDAIGPLAVAVGAAQATIALVDHDTRVIRVARTSTDRGSSTPNGLGPVLRFIEITANGLEDVLATLAAGDTVSLDPDRVVAVSPEFATAMTIRGVQTIVLEPLRTPAGALVGALIVGWDRDHEPELTSQARLAVIADLCEQTAERARLYDEDHRVVTGLLARTLPVLPTVAGTKIAARYLPSAVEIGMGGDWYEVIDTGDGVVSLVIGDVTGHGVAAIADMALFRTYLSTLLRVGWPLATLFDKVSELVALDDPAELRLATAAVLRLTLSTGDAEYVNAGHPPMLIRHPDGSVDQLLGALRPPVGLTGAVPSPGSFHVPPGSVFVAYTDGLVEHHETSIDTGIGRLQQVVSERWTGQVDHAVETILDACLDGRTNRDDIALVVLEYRGVPADFSD
jgi:CHASE1-domain containing sensor protein